MGAARTCLELCYLKDYLPFITFLLLSITGSLGSRSVVKEETSNREINIAKIVLSKDFVNGTNSSLLTHKLPNPLATPIGTDRFGFGPACSERDIDINQMPNPAVPIEFSYVIVVISNFCTSDACRLGNIHVSCGGFNFDKGPTIHPTMLRRISDDDCLVNNGDPLGQSEVLIFEYYSIHIYPFSVSSVTCV
ncbi:TPD1 protein homolog 1-like [Chenopodium quinoa]|uniref:TPD1 protein homolog 1-like n=1 Tax=Chenopodium quinoa TaxID=63459 RepID=UPI000B78719A|nr:TPD1 protein homolog 1-like [Chenopodium quinoa]